MRCFEHLCLKVLITFHSLRFTIRRPNQSKCPGYTTCTRGDRTLDQERGKERLQGKEEIRKQRKEKEHRRGQGKKERKQDEERKERLQEERRR